MVEVEADPAELGFDAARLSRIDTHFRRYVDDGLLPGWLIAVSRKGKLVHLSCYGQDDVERGTPVTPNTIFRIYSMTKPVTSVAAMALYERGAFELKDPVSRFVPAFADVRVFKGGSALKPMTEPATEPMRIWHLLTHTAGLTYGFHHSHPVDAMYRAAGFEWSSPAGSDLAAACDTWASLPLLFQPGREWNYGVSTDVLGRVVEVAYGKPLDECLRELVLDPLGMTETGFHVSDTDLDRLAALYVPDPSTRRAIRYDALGAGATKPPAFLSGGGGLVSTVSDYRRFTDMLLGDGEHDGARILGTRTARFMRQNHLPGGVDLETFGRPLFAETTFDGIGFGLGYSVVLDPLKNKVLSTAGEFAWGGAASTAFWVDPAEQLTAMFFTQLLPSSTHPIRPQLKQLVYQALVD